MSGNDARNRGRSWLWNRYGTLPPGTIASSRVPVPYQSVENYSGLQTSVADPLHFGTDPGDPAPDPGIIDLQGEN